MEVENEDEQGIRKHKSRLGSLHHGSIVWGEQFLCRTERKVTLSFQFSLSPVHAPEWHEEFVVSLLAYCTKISLCRLGHYCLSLHKDTTPPQPNNTVTPTHIEPKQYTHTQSQAPEDECTSIRNMLSKK